MRRYMVLGQAGSTLVLLFGFVSLSLFLDPALVGTPVLQQNIYRGDPVWAFSGIFFLSFGMLFLVVSGRWARRLLWIWKNVMPEPMNLSIEVDEASDSTSYHAVLSPHPKGSERKVKWKVSLYNPSWDVTALQSSEVQAQIYFDPRSRTPAVIEAEHGLLWAMAGSGAVCRI